MPRNGAESVAGAVDVHDTDMVEELVIDGNDHIKTHIRTKSDAHRRRSRIKRPMSTPNPRSRSANMDPQALIGHTLKLQDWLNEKSVKNVQEKADVEAKNTRKMYNTVLETEDTFVKEVGDAIDHHEMLELRKREILHKRWTERVHEPIRRQIDQQMYGPGYPELCLRKRQLHKEYLEHVNRKGHVFLDTYAPDEYFPMGLHPVRPAPLTESEQSVDSDPTLSAGLVAETKPLRDPLLAQARDRNEEDRVILRCMTGQNYRDRDLDAIRLPPLPLVPLGRHGTECRTWLAMPMGDIESPVRLASRRRMKGIFNDSQINFDKWSRLPYSSALVEEELQTQHRRSFDEAATAARAEQKNIIAPTPTPAKQTVAMQT